jgi:Na+-driven multidrug efflux pump/anti-sigma regulatory factor (Ser/Thr protein kinase)
MSAGNKTSKDLLSKLFFNMLPVQILIFAMGSINSIVDGAMAGRFIDAASVGVIGLFYSVVRLILAISSVFLGGTSVLCGRYMGKGETDNTEGVFSLNLTITVITGLVFTGVCLGAPSLVADILGSSEELKPSLMTYIVGYSFGVLPMLLSDQLASFLQLERQNWIGYIGVAGMIISNVTLDVLLVAVFKLGVWGLALATSISNTIYLLILLPYYFTSKAQLHYSFKKAKWSDLGSLIGIGFPGALLIFCLSFRGIVINRILLKYSGNDGLSAMASFSMVSGMFIAYCLGNGSIVRMFVSIFVGEEDKYSIKKVMKIVMTKGLLISIVFAAFIYMISPLLTSIFFADKNSNVYHLTYQLFAIYAFCIPLVLICQVFTNYLQASGHYIFVNVQSVFDGFFAMVIPAIILAPVMGTLGVWIANPIGIILTILTVPVYSLIYWKRIPRNMDEVFFFKPNFGVEPKDSLDLPIRDMNDVADSSEKVQNFCEEHGIGKKASMYSALCLEEMAGNVVRHGFTADKKKHALNIRVVYLRGDVMLRIKDDCIPFDPSEMAEMVAQNEETENIGIRMVYKLSDEVTYQNLLGLNVLTTTIKEDNLASLEANDFLLEKTLLKLDKDLHKRFKNVAMVSQNVLNKYRSIFPEYTDHSELHSLTVIDYCNHLIGESQVKKLNADEIYILLVACYLHDIGMGISEKDYEEFKDRLGGDYYFADHPNDTKADYVRIFHHEFSGLYIDKYWEIYDIPSPEYAYCIKQVARGHRKTDLFDENEYPSDYKLPNGNTVCIPYLAALIRITDEIDVVASRNPMILYDISTLTDEEEINHNKRLYAVKSMKMTEETFLLLAEEKDEAIIKDLEDMVVSMQEKLDYCRQVVEKRTPFKLTQKKILLNVIRR